MSIPDRRAFLSVFAAAGLSSTLMPGIVWAQIQPGTKPISVDTIREAARLAGLTLSDEECADLTSSLSSLAKHAEEIQKATLTNASPLPIHFDPRPPGVPLPPAAPAVFRVESPPAVTRPKSLASAAFWPVTHLAHLLRTRQASSVELTTMYLERLKRYNPQLNCVATLTEERALAEARAADREIAAGRYRGVLHGVPYGVKDIIAANGYPTAWGAAPLAPQTFPDDATVVQRLSAAGAVLVAKLATGELAFGDQWSGGRTNNPWNLQQGSSGSSAGPGAATAAGLVAFSIGTDTGGSILSPSVRCGIVGLRPTFGRVSRAGVMTAGSTLDKVGPMCRHAQDCAIVLRAIAGPDGLDLAVRDDAPVSWDATRGRYPRRIGYVPAMLDAERDPAQRANNDRALALLNRLGCTMRDIHLPGGDLSYFIEYVERAAAFESMTARGLYAGVSVRTGRYLRACQLVTAVDYLQANRRRAAIMQEVARALSDVDAVMFTSLTLDSRTSLNPVMSLTGHPSVAVPNGFSAAGTPTGVMFSGHLYREGELLALAKAYQDATGGRDKQPPLFAV
jgi:Asp-tRNA(Asn)/Glu-tRNA(Gln) amidotransferase A subunit family amidase/Asp-tRNA(Asn)/Glu-tRNA(Gln) amidotransferase C subunit